MYQNFNVKNSIFTKNEHVLMINENINNSLIDTNFFKSDFGQFNNFFAVKLITDENLMRIII